MELYFIFIRDPYEVNQNLWAIIIMQHSITAGVLHVAPTKASPDDVVKTNFILSLSNPTGGD